MFESFNYLPEEIEEGLRDGWLHGDPPHYNIPVMPQWRDEERTHLQMYENTTEGTPISPVMETAEELAEWLNKNGATIFANFTISYEEWLAIINGEEVIIKLI